MELVLDDKIVLGGGHFAKVFHATIRLHNNSYHVAAKKSIDRARLLAEARFLERCQGHQNVLKFKDFVKFRSEMYLITEFAREGNLQEKLGSKRFTTAQKSLIVRQICLGLDHVHSKNILHRNIEPRSILFKDFEKIVLSGFSRAEENVKGKPMFHCIEAVPDIEYTLKSDIYLLALLVFQIFEDRRNVDRKALGDEIQVRDWSEGLSKEIFKKEIWVQTIVDSLFWKPERRPTAIEFHSAFRE